MAEPASVSIDGPTGANASDEITLDISITNTGTSSENYIGDVTLPAEWSVKEQTSDGGQWNSGDLQWLWQSLGDGDTVTPSITVSIPASETNGSYSIEAAAKTDEGTEDTSVHTVTVGETDDGGGDDGNNTDSGGDNNQTISVASNHSSAALGSNTDVNFTVQNNGSNSTAVILDTGVPEPLTVTNVSSEDGNYQSADTKWLWQTVSPGAVKNATLTVHIPANSTQGLFDITGEAKIKNGSEVSVADQTRATLEINDDEVTVFSNRSSVALGENTTLNFTVANTGENATAAVLDTAVPSAIEVVKTSSDGGNYQSSDQKWLWQTIAAGERAHSTMTVRIPADPEQNSYDIVGTAKAKNDTILKNTSQTTQEFSLGRFIADPTADSLDVAGQGGSATITQGNSGAISTTITNIGGDAGDFTLDLSVGGVDRSKTVTNLEASDSTTVTFSDPISGLSSGNYQVNVDVSADGFTRSDSITGGLTVESNNNDDDDDDDGGGGGDPGSPNPSLSSFTVAGESSDVVIDEGANRDIAVEISNTGDASGSFSVDMTVGNESSSKSTSTISAGGTGTVVFSGVTDSLSAQESPYTVEINIDGGAITDSIGLTVNENQQPESSLSNLDIAGSGNSATIKNGDTVGVESNVTNVGDAPGTFEVTLSGGSNEISTSTTTAELAPGESELISFSSIGGGLDPQNDSYTVDVSTADDSLTGKIDVNELKPADFDVTIEDTSTPVTQGEPLDVEIEITNNGDKPGTQTVELRDTGFTNTVVDSTELTVDPATTAQRTLTWDTSGASLGDGEITVTTANDSASETISIADPGDPVFDVDITALPTNVTTNEQFESSFKITNTGATQDTQNVTFTLGSEVITESITLQPNSSATRSYSYTPSPDETESVNIAIESEDAASSGRVDVQLPARYAVSLIETNDSVIRGETLTLDYRITNTGELTGSKGIDFVVNGAIEETTNSIEIAPNASYTGSFVYETTADDSDPISVAVTGDTTDSTTIGVDEPANFEVSIEDTNSPVEAGEPANITAVIQNLGDVSGSAQANLSLGDSSGAVKQQTTGPIAGGSATEVTFQHETTASDIGTLLPTITTGESSATQSVAVLQPANFSVEDVETTSPVVVGDTLDVTATIRNVGDLTEASSVDLTIGNETVSASTEDIPSGEVATVTFNYETTPSDVTETSLAVSTDDDQLTEQVSIDPDATVATGSSSVELLNGTEPVFGGTESTYEVTVELESSSFEYLQSTTGDIEIRLDGFSISDQGERLTIPYDTATVTNGSVTVSEEVTAVAPNIATRTDVSASVIEVQQDDQTLVGDSIEFDTIGVTDQRDRTPLNLTANQTDVVTGSEIAFTVTNSSSGSPLNATVSVGDTDAQTGSDGTTEVTVDTVGRLEATATKSNTVETEYAPDRLQVDVQSPELDFSRNTVDFGEISAGANLTKEIIVTNPTPTDIAVDQFSIDGSDSFVITEGINSTTISPGATELVEISYTPVTTGTDGAALSIGDQTIDISGRAVAPEIAIDSTLPVETTAEVGTTESETITISNTGEGDLNASLSVDDDTYSLPETLNIASGNTASFNVEFSPSTADETSIPARLEIGSANPATSNRSVPVIGSVVDREVILSDSEIRIGNVTVGETGSSAVIVDNEGTTTETLNATVDSPFSLISQDRNPFTLSPSESKRITVKTEPTSSGTTSTTLRIENESSPDVNTTATVTANGREPNLSLATSTPVTFGQTSIGSAASKQVRIDNVGTAPLEINSVVADGSFSGSVPSTSTVPPGESTAISVTFTPQQSADLSGNLTIKTNDKDAEVDLSGRGIDTDVSFEDSSIEFGTVGVANTTTQTIEVTNEGSESFSVDTIAVSGDRGSFSLPSVDTIPAGTTESIDVTFAPVTAADQTATVTLVEADEAGENISATLTGTGRAAEFDVSQQTVRTGVTTAGDETTNRLTIENPVGGTELTINELSLSDTDDFAVEAETPITIRGPETAQIPVTFSPDQTAIDGSVETTLSMNASTGERSITETVDITGTVSAPEPTTSSDELSINRLPSDGITQQAITISNDGGESYSISGITAGGDVSADQVGLSEVPPGGETTVVATVNPSSGSDIDETIDIETTSSKAAVDDITIDVSANVVVPEFNQPDDVVFETTKIGSADRQTVVIQNTGDAALRLAEPQVTGTSDMSILSGDQQLRIPSGSSESITIGFTPSTVGSVEGTLELEPLNDPTIEGTQEIEMRGTGTPLQSAIETSTSAITFGDISRGSVERDEVVIENTGDAGSSLEITGVSVLGADSDKFTAEVTPVILNGGDSEPVDIAVNATNAERGSLSSLIRIETTEGSVTVAGAARVVAPELQTRVSNSFESTRLGTTSTAELEFRNTGNAELNISSLSIAGNDSAAFEFTETTSTAMTIEPQETKRADVVFNPLRLDNAVERATNNPLEANANVTFQSNDNTGEESISASANAKTAAIDVPRTVQFGETPIDETSNRSLTIENEISATTPVQIEEISLSGADAGEFEAQINGTRTLSPGDQSTIAINLTPESLDRKFATLTVFTNDTRQPVRKVGISNAETIYQIEYGSVDVKYINPTSGQEPTANVNQGFGEQNATLTRTVANVSTTKDYYLNYTFGDSPSTAGAAFDTSLNNGGTNATALQYMNAETTASTSNFTDSTYQMKVSKAALTQQNASNNNVTITEENVTIYHENQTGDGVTYEPLDTELLYETTRGYVYEVTADSYSVFAVGVPDQDASGDDEDDENNQDEDNNNDDTSSGGGGGGGGGGAGGGGGSPAQQGPPSIEQIRSTLNLVSPTTTATPKIQDADPDTAGVTVSPANTETVNSVTFDGEGLSGSVQITEYADPPQEIRDQVMASVLDAGAVSSSDGSTATDPAVDVLSVADISPSSEQAEKTSATVTLSAPRSEVGNPQQLTVIKETYDFEAQETTWSQLDTTVESTSGDTITVSAQVDEFSLFALSEVEGQSAEQTATDTEGDQQSETPDDSSEGGSGGLIGIAIVLALVVAAAVAYQKRDELSGMMDSFDE